MNSSELRAYKIDKLRHEELQRICWQYKSLRTRADDLLTLASAAAGERHKTGSHSDPVAKLAQRREKILKKASAIERCAKLAGKDNAAGLLFGVTTRGSGYETLQAQKKIFCGRRQYYEMRAVFFWLLDQEL